MPESHVHASSREAPLESEAGQAIAETMQALATPSRVRLLYALGDRELSVGELAKAAEIKATAASQQLRILRHLRLVTSRRDGQSIRYRLYDDHVRILLDEIRNHVEHAARGWESPADSAGNAQKRLASRSRTR